MSIVSSLSWMNDGLCAEPKYENVDFFPDNGDKKAIAKAKAVCKNCIVRSECLEWAYTTKQPDGIYSGFTVSEIKKIGPFIRMREELTVTTNTASVFVLNLTSPKPFVLRVP